MKRAFWRIVVTCAMYALAVAVFAEVWHLAAEANHSPVVQSSETVSEAAPGEATGSTPGANLDAAASPTKSGLPAPLQPKAGARRDAALMPEVRSGGGRVANGSQSAEASSGSSSSTASAAAASAVTASVDAVDDPTTGTSQAPILPALLPTDEHGVFQPNDGELSHLIEDLGIQHLMGSYSTNFDHATPSQADNIALAAKKLNGQVVQPGQVFSYNETVGPFTKAGGFGWGRMFVGTRIVPSIGGGVCQGASTLYNAVILANLGIVERHQHGLTVPYLPPGQDATVTDSGGLDFRFKNTTDKPILIRASAADRWMTVSIYGGAKPPAVTWKHEVLSRQKKTTAFTTDSTLPPGIRKTVAPGQDGVTVHTWITIHYPDGAVTKDLGIDRYKASPQVIAVGPKR